MPQFDETHVKIEGCIVVWDGINHPEPPNDNGNIKRSLKVVIDPNNPDIGILNQLANNELQRSDFKGVLPNGGRMPVGTAGPNEFNGMYPGFAVVNCRTFKMPDVYDEQGQLLMDPMQYSAMIYPGQVVDVLVNASAYNNVSKGIAVSLDGFMIRASLNAPRQNFGGTGIDTSGAFGGQGNQQNNAGQNQNQNFQQPQQNAPQQNYQQQPAQGNQNQNQNYQQPQQNANNAGQNQNQNFQQPQQNAPQQNANTYQPPAQGNQQQNGAPNQAHDYMPQGGNNNQ